MYVEFISRSLPPRQDEFTFAVELEEKNFHLDFLASSGLSLRVIFRQTIEWRDVDSEPFEPLSEDLPSVEGSTGAGDAIDAFSLLAGESVLETFHDVRM
jgi:3-methyladenine DNA glycosylase AlkC